MDKYCALFVRDDSAYKNKSNWLCYDKNKNALNYKDNLPVVCHPPCRTWGKLSHMATRAVAGESDLAIWSINKIRKLGGILEHPNGSKLFGKYLPDINCNADTFGGFTILIDQYDFGHVAHKLTKLYFCGLKKEELPKLPPKDKTIHYCEKGKRRSICGNVKGTTRCTQYQREYTPLNLINYFEKVLDIIKKNKEKS